MEEFITILKNETAEIVEKKSKFIANLFHVESVEEAENRIKDIKKKYHDARHNCIAYRVAENGQIIEKSSDDGEPSGTAGVPMLTVLEKQELTNVVAVVTRYFGGIKLGAGGLIRAYAGSVAQATKEIGLVHVKEQAGLELTLTYPQYQVFANFLEQENLTEQNTQFLEQVTTELYVDPEVLDVIQERLIDFYQGKITMTKIDPQIIEVPLELSDKEDLSR